VNRVIAGGTGSSQAEPAHVYAELIGDRSDLTPDLAGDDDSSRAADLECACFELTREKDIQVL
jgi:hypothetical protein